MQAIRQLTSGCCYRGLLYLVFAIITFNFPSVYPVEPDNMNYTSAAVGVSVVIAALTWFTTGRRQYTGPERGGILKGAIGEFNFFTLVARGHQSMLPSSPRG